eukprot:4845267-Prymnesium_polylepis.1
MGPQNAPFTLSGRLATARMAARRASDSPIHFTICLRGKMITQPLVSAISILLSLVLSGQPYGSELRREDGGVSTCGRWGENVRTVG